MTRPKRSAPILPPGLARVDDPASRKHGYLVRLQWVKGKKPGEHNKPRIKRYFGDHSHGGKRLALRAALAFRAWVLK